MAEDKDYNGELWHYTGYLGPCCEKHFEERKLQWLAK